jgi:hypothetical protein
VTEQQDRIILGEILVSEAFYLLSRAHKWRIAMASHDRESAKGIPNSISHE